jgi:hypothetical protein
MAPKLEETGYFYPESDLQNTKNFFVGQVRLDIEGTISKESLRAMLIQVYESGKRRDLREVKFIAADNIVYFFPAFDQTNCEIRHIESFEQLIGKNVVPSEVLQAAGTIAIDFKEINSDASSLVNFDSTFDAQGMIHLAQSEAFIQQHIAPIFAGLASFIPKNE